ncbi:MAG: arylsulfatase [Acidobacteria bacterium]|nr:arylsulfatase [Acidobacteriota bacterium]
MKRRKFLKTTALSAAALGAAPLYSHVMPKKKPNVIIILTDDQGYGDFSCHGNPILKTPHMDKIAEEGVDFTDFHCCPVCTPTRGQLMTGLDALHNLSCCVTSGRTLMRRDLPTMADFFRKGGYATGLFGKWHLGNVYPDRPMDRGFDKCVWFKGWGLQSEIEFDNDYDNPRYLDGTEQKRASVYCTDLWFNEAISWMSQQKGKDKPFFVYLPTNVPHMPLWPPEQYASLYRDKVGPGAADFFAMIANLDDNVGRLNEWLKKNGLFEDTIVALVTDNGGTMGREAYNAGLREFKASNYEGGHRCACFLRWPNGGFDAGLAAATPTQVQDLLPTLLELCDIPSGKAAFDGVSLLPLLRKKQIKDRMFIVQYGQRQRPVKYDAAVVWKQWRLQKGTELYDIEKDRGQKTDVSAQFPEIAERMKTFYEEWWAKLDPALNSPIPVLIGTNVENPVMLTSIDWWEVDADNINFVSQAVGGPRGGVWTVQVESEGNYRIELRRWPFHTNKPIGSEGPRVTIGGRPLNHKYKLIPAREAILDANGIEKKVRLEQDGVGAVFEVNLSRGKSRLQGWFRDAQGTDLCGAFYALVTKL